MQEQLAPAPSAYYYPTVSPPTVPPQVIVDPSPTPCELINLSVAAHAPGPPFWTFLKFPFKYTRKSESWIFLMSMCWQFFTRNFSSPLCFSLFILLPVIHCHVFPLVFCFILWLLQKIISNFSTFVTIMIHVLSFRSLYANLMADMAGTFRFLIPD